MRILFLFDLILIEWSFLAVSGLSNCHPNFAGIINFRIEVKSSIPITDFKGKQGLSVYNIGTRQSFYTNFQRFGNVYVYQGGASRITVIIVGNGLCELSSNPNWIC